MILLENVAPTLMRILPIMFLQRVAFQITNFDNEARRSDGSLLVWYVILFFFISSFHYSIISIIGFVLKLGVDESGLI